MTPFQQATLGLAFITFVLIIGGLGFWIEFLTGSDGHSVRSAAATWSLSLTGSSALHLFLSQVARRMTAFTGTAVVVLLLLSIPLLVMEGLSDWRGVVLIILSLVLSLWFWIIAYSDDPVFQDTDPHDPVGGDPTRQLSNVGMDGFNV